MSRAANGTYLKWLEDHAQFAGPGCLTWPFSWAVTFRGERMNASRAMCFLAHGEPPSPELDAAHNCGKGHLKCVHPSHVRWATKSENQLDRHVHGTAPIGTNNPQSVLSDDSVRQIRTVTGWKHRDIAALYGISRQTVSAIRARRLWGWLQ